MSPVITKRLKEFQYFSPTTVVEAVSILKDYASKAKVLAGGTDLLSLMKLRAVTPEYIVNLKEIAGLDYIRKEGSELRIGALTTIVTILASDLNFFYQVFFPIHLPCTGIDLSNSRHSYYLPFYFACLYTTNLYSYRQNLFFLALWWASAQIRNTRHHQAALLYEST